MLKELMYALFVMVLVASPSFAMAKEGCGGSCATCHSLSQQEASDFLKPAGVAVKSVKQSPSSGLFEVLVEKDNKTGVLFIDYGKKHLIQGMMVSLPDFKPVVAHLSDLPQQKETTNIAPSDIPIENAIIMGNPKGTKKLYLFTDPDCPYCRKAHVELKKLVSIAPDVVVYLMLDPLPMHPAAFDKARAILESRSQEILDNAFEGKEVPKPTRESSKAAVEAIVKFANANGINGTPTIVMSDGKIQVGMPDAESMKKLLDGK